MYVLSLCSDLNSCTKYYILIFIQLTQNSHQRYVHRRSDSSAFVLCVFTCPRTPPQYCNSSELHSRTTPKTYYSVQGHASTYLSSRRRHNHSFNQSSLQTITFSNQKFPSKKSFQYISDMRMSCKYFESFVAAPNFLRFWSFENAAQLFEHIKL